MLPLVTARPVLGWGFESTRSVLLDVFFWAAYAHNALMQALMGLGVVGAGLLMALFGSCFFVGSPRIRRGSDASAFARSAVFGLAVYLGIQAVVSESFAGTPGFAALVAFLCMLSAADLRQETRAPHGGAAPAGQPRALAW
jgi:O-antigen ligase